MNEYRNILTGDVAVAWKRLTTRFDWTTENKIFEHLLEVHERFCGEMCPLLRSDVNDQADPGSDCHISKEDGETDMSLDLEVEDGVESIDDDSSGESDSDTGNQEESGEDAYIKEEEEEEDIISEIPCKIVSTVPGLENCMSPSETMYPESGGNYPMSRGDNVPFSKTMNTVSGKDKFVFPSENNPVSSNKTDIQPNISAGCLNVYRQSYKKATSSNAKSNNENNKIPQVERDTILNVYESQKGGYDRTGKPLDMERKLLFKVLRISTGVKKKTSSPKGSSTVISKYPKSSSASKPKSSKPSSSDKPKSSKSTLLNKLKSSKSSFSDKRKSLKPFSCRKRSKFLCTEGVMALKNLLTGRAVAQGKDSTLTTGECGLQNMDFNFVQEQVSQSQTENTTSEATKCSAGTHQKNDTESAIQKPKNQTELRPGVRENQSPLNLMLDINPATGRPCLVRCPQIPTVIDTVNQHSSEEKSEQTEVGVSPGLDSENLGVQGKSSLVNLRFTLDPVSRKPVLVICPDEPSTSDSVTRQVLHKKSDHNKLRQLQNINLETPFDQELKLKLKQNEFIGEPQIISPVRPIVQEPKPRRTVQESKPTLKQHELIGEPQIISPVRPIVQEPKPTHTVRESKPTLKQHELIGEPQIPSTVRSIAQEPKPTLNLTLIINPANGKPMLVRSPDFPKSNHRDKQLILTLDPVSRKPVLIPEVGDNSVTLGKSVT